jgi:hypothetical protein
MTYMVENLLQLPGLEKNILLHIIPLEIVRGMFIAFCECLVGEYLRNMMWFDCFYLNNIRMQKEL